MDKYPATNMFFNTTNESGQALKECVRAVNKQEKEVLGKYKELALANIVPTTPYAPSELHKLLPQYPITSIRRAITNLTNAGYLRKTGVKIVSPWGRREHCWQLHNTEDKE